MSINTNHKSLNPFSYIVPSSIGGSLKKFNVNSETCVRISQLALPLLNLYQPLAVYIAAGSSYFHAVSHFNSTLTAINRGEKKAALTEALQLAVAVGSIAGAVFKLRAGLILTATYEVAQNVGELSNHIWKGEYDKAGGAFFQTMRQAIHLISVVDPTPQSMIVALSVQVIFEAYEAWKEFKHEDSSHFYDGMVKVIILSVHAYQLNSHIKGLTSINKPDDAKEIEPIKPEEPEFPQETLQEILNDLEAYKTEHPGKIIDFAAILKDHNQSNELVNANFSKAITANASWASILTDVNFSEVSLVRCQFEGVNLQKARFEGTITGCNFQKSFLQDTIFRNCQIEKCDFQFGNLEKAYFSNTIILQTGFKFANLENARFYSTHFIQSVLSQVNGSKTLFLGCHLKDSNMGQASFREAQFNQTYFSGLVANNANFVKSTFRNCRLSYSSFLNGLFKGTRMTNLVITQSNFSDATFNYGRLQQVIFDQTTLDYSSFHDVALSHCRIRQSTLIGTSFFDSKVEKCQINFSDLTDCLLFQAKDSFIYNGCTENIITRPIIGLPWNLESPGFTVPKVYRSLKTFKGIPLRFDYLPDDIDITKLDFEVKETINQVSKSSSNRLSIADEVLNQAKKESQIRQIQQKALRYLDHVEAIVLPGGNNVEAEFYGAKRIDGPFYDLDYRRSIFEFSLLKKAAEIKLPIIAICRGFQLSNVYFGGTIKDVDGHWGKVQQYTVKKGLIQKLVGNYILGVSTHRQALDQVASVFKVIIEYEGVIKAAEANGLELYGFQFHPEWVLDNETISKENGHIFVYHIEAAKKYKDSSIPQYNFL